MDSWRWPILDHLRSRVHSNLLEFLDSTIYVGINIFNTYIPPDSCILSMGNNTSAMGCMRKSNFKNDGENDTDTVKKLTAARHLS